MNSLFLSVKEIESFIYLGTQNDNGVARSNSIQVILYGEGLDDNNLPNGLILSETAWSGALTYSSINRPTAGTGGNGLTWGWISHDSLPSEGIQIPYYGISLGPISSRQRNIGQYSEDLTVPGDPDNHDNPTVGQYIKFEGVYREESNFSSSQSAFATHQIGPGFYTRYQGSGWPNQYHDVGLNPSSHGHRPILVVKNEHDDKPDTYDKEWSRCFHNSNPLCNVKKNTDWLDQVKEIYNHISKRN